MSDIRDPALVAAHTAIAEAIAVHASALLEVFKAQRPNLVTDDRMNTAARHSISRLEALFSEFPSPPPPLTTAELLADLQKAIEAESDRRRDQILQDAMDLLGRPRKSHSTAANVLNMAATKIQDARWARPLTPEEEWVAIMLRMQAGAVDQILGLEKVNLDAIAALAAAEDIEGLRNFSPAWEIDPNIPASV